jgi:hypothetical protein
MLVYAKGYRRYQRTACRITSPGYWRPLNGFVAEIGTDSYPINLDASNFATKPWKHLLKTYTWDLTRMVS